MNARGGPLYFSIKEGGGNFLEFRLKLHEKLLCVRSGVVHSPYSMVSRLVNVIILIYIHGTNIFIHYYTYFTAIHGVYIRPNILRFNTHKRQ